MRVRFAKEGKNMLSYTIELTDEEADFLFKLLVTAQKEVASVCRKYVVGKHDLDNYQWKIDVLQKKLLLSQLKACMRMIF